MFVCVYVLVSVRAFMYVCVCVCRLQDRIQQLLESVGALREELRDSFKSSQTALTSMTVERREWQVSLDKDLGRRGWVRV